jgi:hypothetical protein
MLSKTTGELWVGVEGEGAVAGELGVDDSWCVCGVVSAAAARCEAVDRECLWRGMVERVGCDLWR